MPRARIIAWLLLLAGLLTPAWALSGRREVTATATSAPSRARRASHDGVVTIRAATDLAAARYAGWMDAEKSSEKEDSSESEALWHGPCPFSLPDGPRLLWAGSGAFRICAPATSSLHRRC